MINILMLPERVLYFTIGSDLTDDEVRQYLAAFSEALQPPTPFSCVFHYVSGQPRKSKLAHRLENAWLKTHKPELARWCQGIAMIPSPGVMGAIQRIVLKGFGRKLFGCECYVAKDPTGAQQWVTAQLADATKTVH